MWMQSTTESSPVDEFLDSYVCWREACEDVAAAYWSWAHAPAEERAVKYDTYRAALEHEEHAALVHSVSAERLGAPVR
jgi:hypothetical protein